MVKVVDRGWDRLRRLAARQPVGGRAASVGIQGNDAQASHDGITNAELGAVHEYGTRDGRIPERSFIRSTFDEKQKSYQKALDRIARIMLSGEQIDGELMLLGEKYRADIIDKIKSGIEPPLSERTIEKKKGELTPLIDTGQLWNSISAVVVDAKDIER